MKLEIEIIENFFEARFEPVHPGPGLALYHFDGFVYWDVVCTERCVYIRAENELGGNTVPVVEFGAYCSRVSASSAGGVGPTLILHPNDTDEPSRQAVLTKLKTGRITLSTSVGASPD